MFSMGDGLSNDVSNVFLRLILNSLHLLNEFFEKWLAAGLCSGMSQDASHILVKITEKWLINSDLQNRFFES